MTERDGRLEREAKALAEARELAQGIASSLPKEIQIAALTLKSKLPFKALSLREVLIHRISELSSAAVELYDGNRVVPAVVLTRAATETLAVLYVLHERVSRFLDNKDLKELDDFLMKGLVGSRNNPDLPLATSVLTYITRLDKKFDGFERTYQSLCEIAHPNWAGTTGAYSETDKEAFVVKLGPSPRSGAFLTGVSALAGTLLGFHHYYNELAGLIRRLNEYFEAQPN